MDQRLTDTVLKESDADEETDDEAHYADDFMTSILCFRAKPQIYQTFVPLKISHLKVYSPGCKRG